MCRDRGPPIPRAVKRKIPALLSLISLRLDKRGALLSAQVVQYDTPELVHRVFHCCAGAFARDDRQRRGDRYCAHSPLSKCKRADAEARSVCERFEARQKSESVLRWTAYSLLLECSRQPIQANPTRLTRSQNALSEFDSIGV